MPKPKAEDDSDTEAIEQWLAVTQQPMADWDWNGQELRLQMTDGSTETYTRQQLEQAGVFGEMSFAESQEDDKDDDEGKNEGDGSEGAFGGDDEGEGSKEEGEDKLITLDGGTMTPGETCSSGQDMTIRGILGVTPGEGGDAGAEPEAPAERLAHALDDVVSAILGVVSDATGGQPAQGAGPEGESTGEMAMTEPDERPDDKYCPEQLAKGIAVEKEHTDDEEEAKKIAKDHLDEDPEYYAKLEQVEGK